MANLSIADLEPAKVDQAGAPVLAEIFATLSRDRSAAASLVLGYLQAGGDPQALADAARRLIFLKGNNSHDYKFSSAVLEDYQHISPSWRDRYLASSVFSLRGSGDPDNELVGRIRAALGG